MRGIAVDRYAGLSPSARKRAEHMDRKAAAHRATKRAIDAGVLVRASHCECCRGPGRARGPAGSARQSIHAHHPDYSKPLEVEWLCHKCHFRVHADAKRTGLPLSALALRAAGVLS